MHITIKCNGRKIFRVWAEDYGKQNSKYADRQIEVNGEREIYFSFPVSPKELLVAVVNVQNPQDNDFTVKVVEKDLQTYNIWMDEKTKDFVDFMIPFCQSCGYIPATPKGKVYESQDFTIVWVDVIRDKMTGTAMTTPARIGHQSGRIENSKMRFDKFTIPMRVIIDLHEYSHKYKNPKIGLPIDHETGADINALYLYLGMGFSKIDAICVFANVFLKAQTPANIRRMRKINDYIQKFENQEFAQLN